jgi:lipopolysaccharide assembly LptE-like protein
MTAPALRRPSRLVFLLVAMALAGASACGYGLVGRGVASDPTIKKIGVPLFKDVTGKPGLDQKITQKVIEELLRRGRFQVVQQATDVDAVVEGEFSYQARPVGYAQTGEAGDSRTQASRYLVTVTAKVRYAKSGSTEPIWANDAFSYHDEYDVGLSPGSGLELESSTLDRLATAFARSLVAAMLEAF